jgi:excisionase family DNA binding protein
MSDRPADRRVPPLARASARKRAYTADGTNDGTNAERGTSGRGQHAARSGARPRTGTLGGSNRMLSAREVAAILSVPERTIREKWRDWKLPAYRIGKHLRWKEREVHAWIDRHAA